MRPQHFHDDLQRDLCFHEHPAGIPQSQLPDMVLDHLLEGQGAASACCRVTNRYVRIAIILATLRRVRPAPGKGSSG